MNSKDRLLRYIVRKVNYKQDSQTVLIHKNDVKRKGLEYIKMLKL